MCIIHPFCPKGLLRDGLEDKCGLPSDAPRGPFLNWQAMPGSWPLHY
jgi:hypothetical protein